MSADNDMFRLESEVVNVLKNTYDPEIPVNIYDLGLVYDIDIENNNVKITMTLTAPNCPVADILPAEIKERISGIEGVVSAEVKVVFDPPWNQSMMSEEALFDLGML
jgi:FeS assembly SUF system protein